MGEFSANAKLPKRSTKKRSKPRPKARADEVYLLQLGWLPVYLPIYAAIGKWLDECHNGARLVVVPITSDEELQSHLERLSKASNDPTVFALGEPQQLYLPNALKSKYAAALVIDRAPLWVYHVYPGESRFSAAEQWKKPLAYSSFKEHLNKRLGHQRTVIIVPPPGSTIFRLIWEELGSLTSSDRTLIVSDLILPSITKASVGELQASLIRTLAHDLADKGWLEAEWLLVSTDPLPAQEIAPEPVRLPELTLGTRAEFKPPPMSDVKTHSYQFAPAFKARMEPYPFTGVGLMNGEFGKFCAMLLEQIERVAANKAEAIRGDLNRMAAAIEGAGTGRIGLLNSDDVIGKTVAALSEVSIYASPMTQKLLRSFPLDRQSSGGPVVKFARDVALALYGHAMRPTRR